MDVLITRQTVNTHAHSQPPKVARGAFFSSRPRACSLVLRGGGEEEEEEEE